MLVWIYRANYNARQLGATTMEFTPGWSVGWFFIPIGNLWKPFQAVKQIWQASKSAEDWKEQKAPALLRWWWFFWLVSIIISRLAFEFSGSTETLKELKTSNIVSLCDDSINILLFLLFLTIVSQIYRMQMSQYRMKLEIGSGVEY